MSAQPLDAGVDGAAAEICPRLVNGGVISNGGFMPCNAPTDFPQDLELLFDQRGNIPGRMPAQEVKLCQQFDPEVAYVQNWLVSPCRERGTSFIGEAVDLSGRTAGRISYSARNPILGLELVQNLIELA